MQVTLLLAAWPHAPTVWHVLIKVIHKHSFLERKVVKIFMHFLPVPFIEIVT